MKDTDLGVVERMSWEEAMWNYGNDKPDTRFEMKITNIKSEFIINNQKPANGELVANASFGVFDNAETILAIAVPEGHAYTRKQTDEITDWVKRPQIGMQGMVFIKCNPDGSYKSSVDKFYDAERLKNIATACNAKKGDIIFILAGTEERN